MIPMNFHDSMNQKPRLQMRVNSDEPIKEKGGSVKTSIKKKFQGEIKDIFPTDDKKSSDEEKSPFNFNASPDK